MSAKQAQAPKRLYLEVSATAAVGQKITALIEGGNLGPTSIELGVPDTVVVSRPHTVLVGEGNFRRQVDWLVQIVNVPAVVELRASDATTVQIGLCKIVR